MPAELFMMEQNTTPPGNKRSRLKIAVKIVAVLLVITAAAVLGFLLLLKTALTGQRAAGFLIPRIEEATGTRISYSSVVLDWPSFDLMRFSMAGVKAVSAQAADAEVFSMGGLTLEISPSALLHGRFLVTKLQVVEPTVVIRATADGFRLPDSFPDIRLAPPPVKPVIRELEVSQGKLLVRGSPAAGSETVILSGLDIVGRDLSPDGAESLTVKAATPGPGKTGSLDAAAKWTGGHWPGIGGLSEGRVKLTDFSVVPVQILGFLGKAGIVVPQGTIDLDLEFKGGSRNLSTRGQLNLSGASVSPGALFTRKVGIDHTRVTFAAEITGDDVRVDLQEVVLPGVTFSGEARIAHRSSPDPTLTLVVKRAELELDKFFPVLPLGLFRKADRDRLLQAGLKGRITVPGGQWTGKLSEFLEKWNLGMFVIDILLDKVSGFIPGMELPVTEATGQVRVSTNEILFKGISLTVGASPIVLNGWVQDLQTTPHSDLFISMTSQAQDLKPILENRVVAAHVGPWIGWILDPQGGLSVDLDVKGSLRNPSLKGRVNLEDFQFRVESMALPLKKVNGALRFRSSTVSFSGIKGLLGDSPFEVGGNVSREETDLTGDLKLVPADLKKLGWLPQSWTITERVPFNAALKGKTARPSFSLAVDLKGNGLRLGSVVRKNPGVPMRIEAAGSRDPEGVTVEGAYLIVGNTKVSGKVQVNGQGKATLLVNLPPKGVETDALLSLIDPDLELQPGGRIEGDASVRFSLDKPQDIQTEANLSLHHVSLRPPGFYKRAEGITGTIHRRPRSVNVNLERVKVGSSMVQGTISVADFDNPRLEVSLEASYLDTTDFTAPPGYVHRLTWGEWIRLSPVIRFLAACRGTGSLKIAKGKTALRTFANFQAIFEGAGGTIRASKWQMGFAEGTVRGSALFDIKADTVKPMTLDFQADQLKVDRLLLADPERVRIEGDMGVDGHLEWKLGNINPENNGLYKTGTFEVRLHEGIVRRFDVLSKIFSLVNLGSLLRGRLPDVLSQGLPFQRITWKMEVFDNKWHVKDLRFVSDAARIDSSGMYFSGQQRIDFKVDVSPLVGIDAIVSGLFGNLISKDGKTLTTTFRVRGLPASPDVRLEAFENIRVTE